jgi:hypothetical protein
MLNLILKAIIIFSFISWLIFWGLNNAYVR